MKIGAYILVADPTWIAKSVGAYYDIVDILIVSFDSKSTGWTGGPIPVEKCLTGLREMDCSSKIVEISGDYSTFSGSPMERETKQRQDCIDFLSHRVDWILQLDTDEFIPDITKLLAAIEYVPLSVAGVEWPMRVLYRDIGRSRYLAISDRSRNPVYEYPGPVLVRKNVRLRHARCIHEPIVRYSVAGDTSSLQLRPEHTVGIQMVPLLLNQDAIIHNSWARSPSVVWTKVNSWGHSEGLKSWCYFLFVWLLSPLSWRFMTDIHPFARGLWPRLCVVTLNIGKC